MADRPEPTRKPLVLLVGHCGPDAGMLRSAVRAGAPEAVFESANDRAALAARLGRADLLLVNRALDGEFDAADGVELIRGLLRDSPSDRRPAAMLVSNYPEAQAEAVKAGALPGFGKAEAYADSTRERIRRALEHRRAAGA